MRMRPLTQPLVSDCSAFLFSTELGQRYYPLRKLLDDAVEKACQRDAVFLAYEGQRLVGVLWYVEEGSFYTYPYLHMIVVDKSCRGKGYGRQMLAYMEERLLEKRVTSKNLSGGHREQPGRPEAVRRRGLPEGGTAGEPVSEGRPRAADGEIPQ